MTSLTLPAAPVRDILERAFAEDAPSGDITSQLLIPAEARPPPCSTPARPASSAVERCSATP
ncbi:nicotinate-Nucleotide pyrophosphorylase [Arthrobacter sp. Hiyo4]|nr:nicotinate-Nucleotide pyrophosphorylase [Arthrobacter sp. Hiyo4]